LSSTVILKKPVQSGVAYIDEAPTGMVSHGPSRLSGIHQPGPTITASKGFHSLSISTSL
jgi:hypothetical protein